MGNGELKAKNNNKPKKGTQRAVRQFPHIRSSCNRVIQCQFF